MPGTDRCHSNRCNGGKQLCILDEGQCYFPDSLITVPLNSIIPLGRQVWVAEDPENRATMMDAWARAQAGIAINDDILVSPSVACARSLIPRRLIQVRNRCCSRCIQFHCTCRFWKNRECKYCINDRWWGMTPKGQEGPFTRLRHHPVNLAREYPHPPPLPLNLSLVTCGVFQRGTPGMGIRHRKEWTIERTCADSEYNRRLEMLPRTVVFKFKNTDGHGITILWGNYQWTFGTGNKAVNGGAGWAFVVPPPAEDPQPYFQVSVFESVMAEKKTIGRIMQRS